MKTLTIEITDRCSLNCLHCSSMSKNNGEYFISPERFRRIIKDYSSFDNIRLSGGEPFEHPHIIKLLKKIKNSAKTAVILSCGNKEGKELDSKLLEQAAPYTDSILFSVYGGREFHNSVCRRECFDILKNSIENTIENRVPFSFETVAMKGTIQELGNLFSFIRYFKEKAEYCNPGLKIIRFIKQGRAKSNSQLAIERKEIDRLVLDAKYLANNYDIDLKLGCSLCEKECLAGHRKAAVALSGDRIICSALKYGAEQEKFSCRERW